MHRIAAKVIAHKGTNTFLQTHDFHSGVRNSFADTPDGVKPKVNVLDQLLYMTFWLRYAILVPWCNIVFGHFHAAISSLERVL